MRVRQEFPRSVQVIEHAWIPMRDGCRLAARVWLPRDAGQHPVPAVLEYIPYRKNDATAASDALRHPYLAGFGYAAVRVDLRGTGDSEGLLLDEYLAQEQQDALDVLEWLAAQAWCSGDVGMMGFSWGGFNALQVAALRPPQLKAIVTIDSADDRYQGDCHYFGGCLLAADMLSWATTMAAYTGRPPDPPTVGERWRDQWRQRLEGVEPYVHAWLTHQLYDDYWNHASVCEDYDAVACPVFAVGGWHDPYRDTVFHLLERLSVPRLGLIGPWAHGYPDEARPGPQIGFNQELLRWWDQWLKGVDTGIMDEPMLRAYVLDAHEPATFFADHPGHWVGERHWPPGRPSRRLFLGDAGLVDAPAAGAPVAIGSVETAGAQAGAWCAYAGPTELPPDQRPDDALSLVFDSGPLEAPLEVLGVPQVTLALAADRPLAQVAVRLCDVAPHGPSALVTRGVLNLAHRESREMPTELEPGRRCAVTLPLLAAGYRFAEGHRLRVAVSPAYWPWLWPSPEPVTLTVYPDGSWLELPVRRDGDAARSVDDAPIEVPDGSPGVAFDTPEVARPLETTVVRAPRARRTETRDVGSGLHEIDYEPDHLPGRVRLVAARRETGEWGRNTFRIVAGDPLSAEVRCERRVEVCGDDWDTSTEVVAEMTCDAGAYRVRTRLEARDGDQPFFARTWTFETPRRFA